MAFEDAWALILSLLRRNLEALDDWQKKRIERISLVAQFSLQLLNLRLPPEAQAKLPKDQVFGLSGGQGTRERLKWLFGEGQAS